MPSIQYSSIDFADIALTEVYNDKQELWLQYLPNEIKRRKDVRNINSIDRDKIKKASQLYKVIKDEFLFNLENISSSADKDFKKYFQQSAKLTTDKKTKELMKKVIEEFHSTRKDVNKEVIAYDNLKWFRDPTLLSTIHFHEKLNNVFLNKANDSLKLSLDEEELKKTLDNIVIDKEYIKAIVVIIFQPLLTWAAIYAALTSDYSYILRYNEVVSESAETIFYRNPSMKYLFFENKIE